MRPVFAGSAARGMRSRLNDVPAPWRKQPRMRFDADPRRVLLVPRTMRLEFSASPNKYVYPPQMARGVIGNTPGFDPGIPSSSLGGPVLHLS